MGAEMSPSQYSRSPFFCAAFLSRLQKMISTPRGRANELELAIERTI